MRYYVVDVFTDKLFSGNPAGVCLLSESAGGGLQESGRTGGDVVHENGRNGGGLHENERTGGGWPDGAVMQAIARENNLSETAFLIKRDGYYDLRWFTPELEIDLCGHATMGSAYVIFEFAEREATELKFRTLSGELRVARGCGGEMLMDLPAWRGAPAPVYGRLREAFGGAAINEVRKSNDILVVFENADDVKNAAPDFATLAAVKDEAGMPGDNFGVIITAPGDGYGCDFVSRYFAPNAGVNEDPVTGRAHCMLTPYWAGRLGKKRLTARQISSRGGALTCEDAGERVIIGGNVKLYLSGEIHI